MASKFNIGDVVVLNTKSFEHNNPHISKSAFTFNSNEKTFDVSFQPPYMTVIETREKQEKDTEKKQENTKVAEYLVKCMWFNNVNNKYSEHLFPQDVLMLATESDQKTKKIDIFLQTLFIFGLGFGLSWFFNQKQS